MSLSDSFGGFWDRATYVLAEAQFLVAGVLVSIAIALLWFRPEIPGVPPIFAGWTATFLLLGPPLLGFFIWLFRKLRTRNMVNVHQVNAYQDVVEKWYVDPETWADKDVDGPNPYPINQGDAWAVQEFEFDEEMDQLRVKGVWLEETSDVKLMTSKSHFKSIYTTLTESHIAFNIMRDSVSELGAKIQKRITNRGAEARERGKMMDKTAVSEVFEEFEDRASDHGPDDLPTLEGEEIEGEPETNGHDPMDTDLGEIAEAAAEEAAAATDGGTNE